MTSHGFDLYVGDRAEAARHPGRFATRIVGITEQHGKVKVLLSDGLTLNAEDVRYLGPQSRDGRVWLDGRPIGVVRRAPGGWEWTMGSVTSRVFKRASDANIDLQRTVRAAQHRANVR